MNTFSNAQQLISNALGAGIYHKFVIYDQDHLANQSNNESIAIELTALVSHLEYIQESKIINVRTESGQMNYIDKYNMPNIIKLDVMFQPKSANSQNEYNDMMAQKLNKLEEMKNNNRMCVLIPSMYTRGKLFTNYKITEIKTPTEEKHRTYLYCTITMQQISMFNAEYGYVDPKNAKNPTYSSVIPR